MRKVKITVLECTRNRYADEYGVPGLPACPWHKPGDVFIFDKEKPAGLCEDAWIAIERSVFAFAFGGNDFWEGWLASNRASINCCNDGMRPVIFKIEPYGEFEGVANSKESDTRAEQEVRAPLGTE